MLTMTRCLSKGDACCLQLQVGNWTSWHADQKHAPPGQSADSVKVTIFPPIHSSVVPAEASASNQRVDAIFQPHSRYIGDTPERRDHGPSSKSTHRPEKQKSQASRLTNTLWDLYSIPVSSRKTVSEIPDMNAGTPIDEPVLDSAATEQEASRQHQASGSRASTEFKAASDANAATMDRTGVQSTADNTALSGDGSDGSAGLAHGFSIQLLEKAAGVSDRELQKHARSFLAQEKQARHNFKMWGGLNAKLESSRLHRNRLNSSARTNSVISTLGDNDGTKLSADDVSDVVPPSLFALRQILTECCQGVLGRYQDDALKQERRFNSQGVFESAVNQIRGRQLMYHFVSRALSSGAFGREVRKLLFERLEQVLAPSVQANRLRSQRRDSEVDNSSSRLMFRMDQQRRDHNRAAKLSVDNDTVDDPSDNRSSLPHIHSPAGETPRSTRPSRHGGRSNPGRDDKRSPRSPRRAGKRTGGVSALPTARSPRTRRHPPLPPQAIKAADDMLVASNQDGVPEAALAAQAGPSEDNTRAVKRTTRARRYSMSDVTRLAFISAPTGGQSSFSSEWSGSVAMIAPALPFSTGRRRASLPASVSQAAERDAPSIADVVLWQKLHDYHAGSSTQNSRHNTAKTVDFDQQPKDDGLGPTSSEAAATPDAMIASNRQRSKSTFQRSDRDSSARELTAGTPSDVNSRRSKSVFVKRDSAAADSSHGSMAVPDQLQAAQLLMQLNGAASPVHAAALSVDEASVPSGDSAEQAVDSGAPVTALSVSRSELQKRAAERLRCVFDVRLKR